MSMLRGREESMNTKKLAVSVHMGLLLAAGVAFAQSPTFNITAPADGAMYRRGASVTVRWTHSAFYDANPAQHAIPYCQPTGAGGPVAQIAAPVPVKNDQFVWEVGRKFDGSWLAPGQYEITMESLDYDELSGPNITIFLLEFKPIFLRRKLELPRIPEVPQGFMFDPRWIELDMEGLPEVRLELLQNGKRLADLGKFGKGGWSSGPVKLQLDQRSVLNPSGFELHVLSSNGKLLLKQPIDVALQGK
jgi:hypothetical protein